MQPAHPTLTVAISTRALFTLEEENEVLVQQGEEAYDRMMVDRRAEPLRPGAAFDLVRKLLNLNEIAKAQGMDVAALPAVDVVLLSRNSPSAGQRVMRSIEAHGLAIRSAIFTRGLDPFRYARPMQVDLFLSAEESDVSAALHAGIAAAVIDPTRRPDTRDDVLRIAFDGDAVIFDASAEAVHQAHGLEAFTKSERSLANTPLPFGPFEPVLRKLIALRAALDDQSKIRVGLFTARSVQAHERVMMTLLRAGLAVDELVWCAGRTKGPLLKTFAADLFVDDGSHHVANALENRVLGAHVPVRLMADEIASAVAQRPPVLRQVPKN